MRAIYTICKYFLCPGAYVHAFWEQLMCRILKLPVETKKYFGNGIDGGHVKHAPAKNEVSAFLIACIPGFVNFITGVWFFLAGFMNLRFMGITVYDSIPIFVVSIVLIYFGVSFLCNIFPLREDIATFWTLAYKSPFSGKMLVLRVIAFIPALITKIGAFAQHYCIPELFWAAFIVLAFTVLR
ncbi:MAG: hypothetical protein K6B52_07565 [Clostridiales bacterium]|nr:hypothetical protein [Clostridiales bacterium]